MYKKNYEKVRAGGITEFQPSKVRPEYESSTNINKIMQRFQKTGQLPDLIKRNPQYGDFSSTPDYLNAQLTIVKAHEQFEALSSTVRKRFQNDPAQFLEFMGDEKNIDEIVKLGLAAKKEPQSSEVTGGTGAGGGIPEKEGV